MNILIIRFSALGDLVQLEPMLRAIRFFYQESNIEFITSGIGKGLYEDTPYIDKYIVHSKIQTTIKEIDNKKYDLVFNLHCNSLSHILLFFIKYTTLINFSHSLKQKLLQVKASRKTIEEVMLCSGVAQNKVEEYFLQKESKMTIFPFSDTKSRFSSNKKIVAISTGSSEKWISKQWGVKKYIKLIQLLIKENIDVILVGTHLELEDAENILNVVSGVTNFVDKTNLTELKNLLGNVDLYIGNDSGPTHIAAAVGTNTVTIFGSTDIKHCPKYGSYQGVHKCISPSKKISCHPCYKAVCPTNMECMDDIKVEEVYRLSKEVL